MSGKHGVQSAALPPEGDLSASISYDDLIVQINDFCSHHNIQPRHIVQRETFAQTLWDLLVYNNSVHTSDIDREIRNAIENAICQGLIHRETSYELDEPFFSKTIDFSERAPCTKTITKLIHHRSCYPHQQEGRDLMKDKKKLAQWIESSQTNRTITLTMQSCKNHLENDILSLQDIMSALYADEPSQLLPFTFTLCEVAHIISMRSLPKEMGGKIFLVQRYDKSVRMLHFAGDVDPYASTVHASSGVQFRRRPPTLYLPRTDSNTAQAAPTVIDTQEHARNTLELLNHSEEQRAIYENSHIRGGKKKTVPHKNFSIKNSDTEHRVITNGNPLWHMIQTHLHDMKCVSPVSLQDKQRYLDFVVHQIQQNNPDSLSGDIFDQCVYNNILLRPQGEWQIHNTDTVQRTRKEPVSTDRVKKFAQKNRFQPNLVAGLQLQAGENHSNLFVPYQSAESLYDTSYLNQLEQILGVPLDQLTLTLNEISALIMQHRVLKGFFLVSADSTLRLLYCSRKKYSKKRRRLVYPAHTPIEPGNHVYYRSPTAIRTV